MRTKAFAIVLLLSILCFVAVPRTFATTDKAFTTVRLNKFGSVAIRLGQKFGFDIGGFITPFFNKEKQQATPDFFPGADFKESISNQMMPQSKLDFGKFIKWNESMFPVILTALYGAILQTDAEHSNHPEKTDCFISTNLETSDPLPNAPTHFWTGQFLNGVIGIREIMPNEGDVINTNRPNRTLAGMNPNEDCKKHQGGEEREPKENDLRVLSQFGAGTETEGQEMTTIMKIIEFFNRITGQTETREVPETEPHKDDVILTKDQKQPWFNFMCNDYWCPGNETGDDSSMADVVGGWTNAYFSFNQQQKVLAASIQPHQIQVVSFPQKNGDFSYDAFNQSQYGMQKVGCATSPYTPNKNIQEELSLGGKVKIIEQCIPPEQLSCSEKWFEELNVDHEAGSSGASGDPGYSIPFRNGSCALNPASRDMYLKIARWWCAAGACNYGAMETELTDEVIGQMNEYGKQYGWSPLFMMALWIHESGLGSHTNASHHMGCTYGWPAKGNTAIKMPEIGDPDDGMCSQMACLFSFPHDNPEDFAGFMCSYNTTAISNGSCPSGEAWTFASEMHDIYAKLVACTSPPGSCGIASDTTGRGFTCDDLKSGSSFQQL